MRLISCHIENFGKLHDKTIHFSEGATIICEENGWGKSTLAAFIRAMFYGLEGERKRSIEENERKRYAPWQGGVFGGKLTFEVGVKQYTITRTFHEKEEFELRDAKTNLVSNDYSDKIGEELFKVNRESFMRTVFIAQSDCETAVTDDVNAKIGNLAENSNDLNCFEAANARLKEMLNSLTPNRKTGSIAQRKQEITEYERKVAVGNEIPNALQLLQDKRKEELQKYSCLKEELDATLKAQVHVNNMEKASERIANYEMTEEEQKQLATLHALFDKMIPQERDIEENLSKVSRIGSLKTELWREQVKQAELARQKTGILVGEVLGISGIVLTCVDLLADLGIFSGTGAILLLSGILLTVAGTLNRKKKRKAEEDICIKLESEIRRLQKSVQAFLQNFYACESKEEDLAGCLHELKNQVLRYEFLQEKKQKWLQAKADYDRYRKLVMESSDSDIISQMEEDLTLSDLNEKLTNLTHECNACSKRIDGYHADLEFLQVQYDEWEDNQLRLEELRRIQVQEQEKYQRILKVQEYLGRAKETITNRYSAPILERFGEYYGMITKASSEQFLIDANINITKNEQGKQREMSTLSLGYRDLVGICLRVALVDAMYQEERPMLIMDDPFTNLDDEKMKEAKNFLEYIAERYQVIYFTCSRERS